MNAFSNHISYPVTVFHRAPLAPVSGTLAGYSALINHFNLQCPTPDQICAIGEKHKKFESGVWRYFTPRHAPENTIYGHLVFALKYEGVNLAALKALFDHINAQEMVDIIENEPTGSYCRRLWFIYEWLTQRELPIEDALSGNFVDVVDPELQYPGPIRISKRHRVRNNLPGLHDFCPLIRRTPLLDEMIASDLPVKAQSNIGSIHPDLLLRAAAFLLLKDSKASYVIEGENPPRNRIERWGHIIGQAGSAPLSHSELLRLQKIVIEDARFVTLGYRHEGGFIGAHDRLSGTPMPDHISARYQDIQKLMDGLLGTEMLLKNSDYPAVLASTLIGFGFVFIHPFEDGNGRLQRYMLHHVLAEMGFTPKNMIFPISAVILERIHEYREVLESFSKPRLQFIKWRTTPKNNVEVLNETIDLYRYFDATKQAEFLYSCVKETIERILPEEVDYLQKYDAMNEFLKNYLDMPDRMVDLLIRFLSQNKGKLSNRAREREFSNITNTELQVIEDKYEEVFINSC